MKASVDWLRPGRGFNVDDDTPPTKFKRLVG
jgi:hypothetical protein